MRKILALLLMCLFTAPAAAQNYAATAGSGLTFGAALVGGVLYPRHLWCDPTTPTQCVVVDASGRITLAPNQSVNNAQINGVTPLMGNGVTGTGSQRVTIASDNTAFPVNSTLSAETTKVIGTTRNLGNAGGILDFAGQNAASPASAWLMGCQFNTTPTTITSGNSSPCQLDSAGNLKVVAPSLALAATQGTTTDAPATLPATTAAATEIAMLKAIANAALSAVPVNVNGTATAQTGVTQGTTPSGNATPAAVIDTPLSINGTDCSATVTTTAGSFITASRLNKKVLIKNEGANVVCFNRTGGTATVGTAGTFCLKGATTANAGDGAAYSTPTGMSDEQGWSAISVTGSSLVYCSRQ